MKNKLLLVLFMVCILFGTCGCGKKDPIKEYLGEKIYKKSAFYRSGDSENQKLHYTINCDKFDVNNVKIFTNSFFVLKNNDIYAINNNYNKTYSNGQQCKKVDLNFEIDSVYSFSDCFIINNSKQYRITSNGNVKKSDEKKFEILHSLIPKDKNIIDIVGYDGTNNKLYYQSKDGKIYESYYKSTNWWAGDKTTEQKEYFIDLKEYGINSDEQIKKIDFGFDSEKTIFLLTDKNAYFYQTVNKEECKKYVDVKCKKELLKSDFYEKFKNEIVYIDESFIILKDGRILRLHKSTKYGYENIK